MSRGTCEPQFRGACFVPSEQAGLKESRDRGGFKLVEEDEEGLLQPTDPFSCLLLPLAFGALVKQGWSFHSPLSFLMQALIFHLQLLG